MSESHANETIIPLHEWALVQPEHPAEEKSAGGIILSRDAKKHPRLRAKVLAVGPGEMKNGVLVQTAARPGDVVLLQRHNLLQGLVYHDDENGPCLIPQSEIIAIVRVGHHEESEADDQMKPAESALYSSHANVGTFLASAEMRGISPESAIAYFRDRMINEVEDRAMQSSRVARVDDARADVTALSRRVDLLEERQNLLAVKVGT